MAGKRGTAQQERQLSSAVPGAGAGFQNTTTFGFRSVGGLASAPNLGRGFNFAGGNNTTPHKFGQLNAGSFNFATCSLIPQDCSPSFQNNFQFRILVTFILMLLFTMSFEISFTQFLKVGFLVKLNLLVNNDA